MMLYRSILCIRTDRVVWYWIKMSWLWLCGWLRCKYYKDGDAYQCALLWIKEMYSYNYYLDMMMINIWGLDPMTYNKLWLLIKTSKDISIKGHNLSPSELDNGRWWHPIEEDLPYSSILPKGGYSSNRFPSKEAPISKWYIEGVYMYLSFWTTLTHRKTW